MSKMSSLDLFIKDLTVKAKHCLRLGEKPEEVVGAIYEELFNWTGRDGELRDWALNHASEIMVEASLEMQKANDLKKNFTAFRESLIGIIDLLSEMDRTGALAKLGEENRAAIHQALKKALDNSIKVEKSWPRGGESTGEGGGTQGHSDATVGNGHSRGIA